MVQLALNQYKHIFFKQNNINPTFQEALIRNRTQHLRICLNPMINNLNYASNIP